jgi:hypothetical protein
MVSLIAGPTRALCTAVEAGVSGDRRGVLSGASNEQYVCHGIVLRNKV